MSLSRKKKHSTAPRSQPVYPWSAHSPPLGQSPSPFPRSHHALSTSATAAGELYLFGGYDHGSKTLSNDVYVISTRDFSTTLLQTSGDVPSPRYGYGHTAVVTGTTLLIWGGRTNTRGRVAENLSNDDSFYLLDLGSRTLFMSKPPPTDPSFLRSSIARVDPHRGRWSWARRSSPPYHDGGGFQAFRLRWLHWLGCQQEF